MKPHWNKMQKTNRLSNEKQKFDSIVYFFSEELTLHNPYAANS